MKNHQKWVLEQQRWVLEQHLGANPSRSGPERHFSPYFLPIFVHFGDHFGSHFRQKVDLFRHRFSHQISEGILRGFWWILELIFMTFGLQNRAWIRKGENMKNLVFLKENLCFWRSRALLFGRKIDEKRCRNTMRNRNRLFHDFWSILASILEPKIDKKRQKNDIEIGVEFGDGKSHFCRLEWAGWRQGRWSLERRIRRFRRGFDCKV